MNNLRFAWGLDTLYTKYTRYMSEQMYSQSEEMKCGLQENLEWSFNGGWAPFLQLLTSDTPFFFSTGRGMAVYVCVKVLRAKYKEKCTNSLSLQNNPLSLQ